MTGKNWLAAVGIGWEKTCYEAAKRVAQVLLGESPKGLPFENIAIKKIVLNHSVARKLGITFPPELIQAADAN